MDKLNNLLIFLCAVPVILWWSLVYMEKFDSVGDFFDSSHDVKWLGETFSHAAFYGAVMAGLLGYERGSTMLTTIITLWFIWFSIIGLQLSRKSVKLKDKHFIDSKKETI